MATINNLILYWYRFLLHWTNSLTNIEYWPDQNRKWSRWANEYIPVPAYSHRFHYKTPEKHSLIDKYNTFQKKWLWDLTELWRVWGRFIFAQSMMEIWDLYCLYFRFCQGWYCSHDRIVNKSRSTYQFFSIWWKCMHCNFWVNVILLSCNLFEAFIF